MKRDPIAIVGIGCRFPGANGPDELWQLLSEGRCSVGEIPDDRLGDLERLHAERPATPGRIMSRRGGFLDAIDGFDAPFFGIAPVEVEKLDPQQRLLLETSWEALEDAASRPRRRAAGRSASTSAAGCTTTRPPDRRPRDGGSLEHLDFYTTTGTGRYSLPGRLSFFYDWHGPSLSVDTACSSSLVAVHLACRALWDGDSDLALAGGVNVMLSPYINVAYSQSRMLTPDGRCKFGDASADGYVRSEGCGLLVLKPLAAARADGDRVYAVVRGSAVDDDGQASGYMATPGVDGQRDMLRKAWGDAGLAPHAAQYIEAHGTGTPAGDPVELGAIGAEAGAPREDGARCLVGSIKTNLGHTEGAAGVAGAIKIALAMRHGVIPASLHHRHAQPEDRLGGRAPFEVPTERRPWPAAAAERLAGVSGFGIAGTNAHVVLGGVEAPASIEREAPSGPYSLPLSAASPEALDALARAVAGTLGAVDDALPLIEGATRRRDALERRLVARGNDAAALADALLRGDVVRGRAEAADGGTVFVCSGVGGHWAGMARMLLAGEPVFREALERCDAALAPIWGESALALLERGEALETTDRIQPAVYAIQVALAALWRARGVEPSAVVGHSIGEIAAAAIAGALTLEDAARVIVGRSRFIAETAGQGAMLATGLTLDEARREVERYDGRLSAAVNGPRDGRLRRPRGAGRARAGAGRARGLLPPRARRLRRAQPADGRPARPARPDARRPAASERLAALRLDARRRGARRRAAGGTLLGSQRPRHRPVRRDDRAARRRRAPHLRRAGPARDPLPVDRADARAPRPRGARRALDAARGRRPRVVRTGLGHAVDPWARRGSLGRDGRLGDAALLPWQRRRYWYTDAVDQKRRRRAARRDGTTAWVGPAIALSAAGGGRLWELDTDPEQHPWLAAHRVGEGALWSTASLLATLLVAGRSFEQLRVARWLWLDADTRPPAQLTVDREGSARIAFRPDADVEGWSTLVTARLGGEAPDAIAGPEGALEELSGEALYARLDAVGSIHEPRAHWIHRLRRAKEAFSADVAPIDGTQLDGLPVEPGYLASLLQLGELLALDVLGLEARCLPSA